MTITITAFVLLGIILVLGGLMRLIPAFSTPTFNAIMGVMMIVDGVLFLIGRGG